MSLINALTGVLVNTAAIILGCLAGLIFKRGIPEKFSSAVSTGVGLCVLFIGISGTLKTITSVNTQTGESVVYSVNTLGMILAVVLGAITGTALDLDGKMLRLGNYVEKKVNQKQEKTVSIAQGFVHATLLFCVGAMAITGPIESALNGDHSTLFAKAVLDGVTAVIFTTSMGIGVLFSAPAVLLYQGGIAILAYFAGSAFLTDAMNVQIIATGSLVIVGLALNLLNITKIKVANFLPAIFFAPILQLLFTWLSRWIPALG